MIDRIPRRLRFAFTRAHGSADAPPGAAANDGPEVDFVAYGEDCVLSGRTVLDGDRLTDMLNAHEEYALNGVTVERFDDGLPLAVDDVVVARDELFLVHASGPRGDIGRRKRTTPQHIAAKMGPYEVRGFFHGPPGTDPVEAIRRRKAMVPLTDARIEYDLHGEHRETHVDTVIMNREQVDWMEAIEPDRGDFPADPRLVATSPAPRPTRSKPRQARPKPRSTRPARAKPPLATDRA
jgi:hypothetical protein